MTRSGGALGAAESMLCRGLAAIDPSRGPQSLYRRGGDADLPRPERLPRVVRVDPVILELYGVGPVDVRIIPARGAERKGVAPSTSGPPEATVMRSNSVSDLTVG